MKPRLFIASSFESIRIARAAQAELQHDAETTVWTQGIFKLSQPFIRSLMDELNDTDFALFVLARDDTAIIRSQVEPVPRDNVVFELGLFAGRLGIERCFMLVPEGADLHLPTDLLGLSPATYDPDRRDQNFQAALGPACGKIVEAITRLGSLPARQKEDFLPTPLTFRQIFDTDFREFYKIEFDRNISFPDSRETYNVVFRLMHVFDANTRFVLAWLPNLVQVTGLCEHVLQNIFSYCDFVDNKAFMSWESPGDIIASSPHRLPKPTVIYFYMQREVPIEDITQIARKGAAAGILVIFRGFAYFTIHRHDKRRAPEPTSPPLGPGSHDMALGQRVPIQRSN